MGFRKRRRPTPEFKIPPPFNPITGEHANLEFDGITPHCALLQVAEDDDYEDYVICRGFDPRINRFIDYQSGNANKPGISVAKPYGSRDTKRYRVGEIHSAVLPIQGSANFTAPSPSSVEFRLGQNPGVAVISSRAGHPTSLSNVVVPLYDHNQKAVNWMFVHPKDKELFRFQSIEDLIATSCSACVRRMDGTDAHLAAINDPDQIFEGMEAKTKGLVLYQEGEYYIIQAKCDPETSVDACE